MRHAYLIIAHNEFVVLQRLLDSLDDERTDIYVLFDKKVNNTPNLISKKSGLVILEKRVNIYWGHHSQIEAELLLFNAVAGKNYSYCHLISGVHLPLYSQDYLYHYFDTNYPNQIFSPLPTNDVELNFKVKLRSYAIQYFRHPNPIVSRLSQYVWVFLLRIQKIFKSKRERYITYAKFSNWVSITQDAVDYLVDNEKRIINDFKYTFCADEFFVPTVLKNAEIPFVYVSEDRLLYQSFENTRASVFHMKDFDDLIHSEALFARKFSVGSLDLVDKIIVNYKNR